MLSKYEVISYSPEELSFIPDLDSRMRHWNEHHYYIYTDLGAGRRVRHSWTINNRAKIKEYFHDCGQCGSKSLKRYRIGSEYLCLRCRMRPGVTKFKKIAGTEPGEVITRSRYVGCEFETGRTSVTAEQDLFTRIPTFCQVGTDPTVSGKEVRTPPQTLNVLEETVTEVCEALRASRYVEEGGLHVHLDMTKEKNNPQDLFKMAHVFYSADRFLRQFIKKSRVGSSYCREPSRIPLPKNTTNYSDFIGFIREASSGEIGVNFRPLFSSTKPNTLEIRLLESTLDSDRVAHWIQLLLRIADYARRHYSFDQAEAIKKLKRRELYRLFQVKKQEQSYLERLHFTLYPTRFTKLTRKVKL